MRAGEWDPQGGVSALRRERALPPPPCEVRAGGSVYEPGRELSPEPIARRLLPGLPVSRTGSSCCC